MSYSYSSKRQPCAECGIPTLRSRGAVRPVPECFDCSVLRIERLVRELHEQTEEVRKLAEDAMEQALGISGYRESKQ